MILLSVVVESIPRQAGPAAPACSVQNRIKTDETMTATSRFQPAARRTEANPGQAKHQTACSQETHSSEIEKGKKGQTMGRRVDLPEQRLVLEMATQAGSTDRVLKDEEDGGLADLNPEQ